MPDTPLKGWAAYPPEKRAARQEAVRATSFRRGINRHIREIQDRAKYLTDEQRQQLRELADAQ